MTRYWRQFFNGLTPEEIGEDNWLDKAIDSVYDVGKAVAAGFETANARYFTTDEN